MGWSGGQHDERRTRGFNDRWHEDFPRLGDGGERSHPVEEFPRLGQESRAGSGGAEGNKPRLNLIQFGFWQVAAVTICAIVSAIVVFGARVTWETPFLTIDFTDQACRSADSYCLKPDPEVLAAMTDPLVCDVPEKLICLVPAGATSLEELRNIQANLEGTLGVDVQVLPPISLRPEAVDPGRRQYNGARVADQAYSTYAGRIGNKETVLIAVTPMDIYLPEVPNWKFAFGNRYQYPGGAPFSVVSTFRLADFTGGRLWLAQFVLGRNEAPVKDRTQKMVNKFVGLDYFGLPLSPDPSSPMYNHILSVTDLDRMDDTLPVSTQ
jgi:hypothetical protein